MNKIESILIGKDISEWKFKFGYNTEIRSSPQIIMVRKLVSECIIAEYYIWRFDLATLIDTLKRTNSSYIEN